MMYHARIEATKGAAPKIAPLRNVTALKRLITELQERDAGLPGMAVFYGPSGYGKSTAMTWCANNANAYHVQCLSVWRTRAFCEAILREMSIPPGRTVAHMVDQIAQEIRATARPLIVDEADYLVRLSMIEVLRDIYERSGGAIILIGEEALPTKLMQWERVHGRIFAWVRALVCDLEDCKELGPLYGQGMPIAEDVYPIVLEATGGSVRRIAVEFAKLARHAKLHQLTQITAQTCSEIEFSTGLPPRPRKSA